MKKHLLIVIVFISFCFTGLIFTQARIPIQFENYHTYQDTVNYLKKVSKNYQNISKLIKIGKSNFGRDIYVLVISNMRTGTTIDKHIKLRNMRKEGVKNVKPMENYLGKPAHFICASIHGNEFTGTEVSLYIIDKLLTGYNSDPEIKKLIDKKCFYFCPIVNPDGHYYTLNKGISQRYNSQKTDNDNDGKINEDGPDDLNGDGYVTYFRYKDKKGKFVIDKQDNRLMLRYIESEKTDQQRYSIKKEDFDNDKDGKIGEDSHFGIDLNRNFPEGWFKDHDMPGGQGEYPTSSPEVHAIVEFFTNHRNILLAQFFHTSGGFTYRPMGTIDDTKMNKWDRAVFDKIMGKKYLEIIGEKIPAAWGGLKSDKEKKSGKTLSNKIAQKRGYELPRGWKVSYSENRNKRYSYGMATDWAYKQYGVYSITTELWNASKDIEGFPQFEGKDQRTNYRRELLKYQDKFYGGKFFINWKKFKHPTLGMGEIGGWKPGYFENAFPGKPLLAVCEKHWQFEKFRAGLLPEIKVNKAVAEVISQSRNVKIVKVSVEIENVGDLATNVAEGATLSLNREDVVWLVGDRDKIKFLRGKPFQKLGVLAGTREVEGFSGKKFKLPGGSFNWWQRQNRSFGMRKLSMRKFESSDKNKPSGTKRKVSWLVQVQGNPDLKVVFTSQKGGTEVKKVSFK